MDGCSCEHEDNEHGSVAQFGTRVCLRMDCDCDGTIAELEAQAAMRKTLPKSLLLALCAKYVGPTDARALFDEINATFTLEPR